MLKDRYAAAAWRWTSGSIWRWLAALLILAGPLWVLAQQGGTAAFDHAGTGFNLTGAHQDVRCESCHLKGVFKGTPRDCATCHAQGNARNALGMPAKHFRTSQACDACHSTTTFAGATFNHAGAAPGSCASCHNGTSARGKAGNHVPTTASCDTCHSVMGFAPVLNFDHKQANFGGRTCASCHDGRIAMGKPADHVPVAASARCETCHQATIASGYVSFSGGQMDHTGIATGCANCHADGVAKSFLGVSIRAKGDLNPPHIPSGDNCETCHLTVPTMLIPATGAASVGGTTFAGGRMSHAGITSGCATCHGPAVGAGTFFGVVPKTTIGLNPPHLPVQGACENCHQNAIPSMLIPATGAASVGGTTFANGQMDHKGITSGCAACHGPGINGSSFAGVSSIVAMPPTSPPGAAAHIPSSTACEACHLASMPSGPIPPNAARQPPGSRFATPAPTGAQIHAGVTGGCNACHDTGLTWMGVGAYPITPAVLTAGASYKGFQTRPRATAGPFNVADPAHPAAGDCAQCHASTEAFTAEVMPANHIPTAPGAKCTACHVGNDYVTRPALAAIHANAPSTTSNCALCHSASAAASFANPARGFTIVAPPANHVPTNASCEVCHVGAGSSIAATPVPNGARFANSAMNHVGIATGCVDCHGPSVNAATFAGISRIIVMPPTSPPGAGSHIPSSTACESCHLASAPSGLVPANATRTVPGSGFATPAPTGAQIHAGVTSGCSGCHDTGYSWMGMGAYPITPATKIAGAQYKGFQTRPRAAAGSFNVADAAHPATGDCSLCHSNTNAFTGVDRPANHIPFAASAQCTSCHTGTDYAVMPSITAIHANAPTPNGNCAQCHSAAAAALYAIPSSNFTIVAPPGNHIPTAAPCESCHVGPGSSITATPVVDGARFSGSRMNHAGITRGCADCHGPNVNPASFAGIASIVVMPPTSPPGAGAHIPSSTACESCHLGSLPVGLIPASATKQAPGTAFATPAPSGAQIHAGVTSGCAACHEAGLTWMGMAAYPINPATLVPGAQYKGFQTRPRATAGPTNVADPAHPASGECSICHGNTVAFTSADKPANHIPYAASATCASCHVGSDYSVKPTLTAIHANAPSTSANCAQCHSASAAASFAIPAAGFSIVAPPANHVPTSAPCELCHVGPGSSIAATPVTDGARFANSLFSHSGISGNCAACHGPGITGASFAGITRIVAMPPTSPPGAGSHIPSGTSCETCHLASMPAGLIAANATKSAPGTAFATPAPTAAQIHTGITSGCSACHDTGFTWMGMSAYPISPATLVPGASYKGFQTRPRATAGPFNVADAAHPATGDCSSCHGSTVAFTAVDKPANHIPYAATAQCTSCHTTSDYSLMPTIAAIHANAPSTSSNCAQCHSASAAAQFAIPANNFSIVAPPANHIPTAAPCEQCHVGTGSSIAATPVPNGARFSGSRMSHAGITSGCAACHGPNINPASFAGIGHIVVMPPTAPPGTGSHIPSSTACETCHLASVPAGLIPATATKTAPGTAFATPAPTGAQIHAGVTGGCNACHDTGYVWMGMSAYPISPAVKTAGASYKGFQTRPRAAAGTFNIADAAHPATGDCVTCHASTTAFTAVDKPTNHIPYAATAQCTSCHSGTDYSVRPTVAAIHANAPSTSVNCAQCHATAAAAGFAIPASNFTITAPPTNHVPFGNVGCEVCHVGSGSSVAATPVPNGARWANSLFSHANIPNACADCHGAQVTSATFAGISRIVTLPPTAPMGASSHIPTAAACESCHAGSKPTALLPANASKTAPGTAFATPAPTGAQIHTGISSGCNACHDTGYVWMGMSAYPISPATKTANASYKGFQTRPRAAAGTFNVADAAHPSTGDCSQCHTNTTAFTSADKPANHIPYAATAQCTACHTAGNFSTMPTLAAIHANAQSTTTNCVQCHNTTAYNTATMTIVGPPAKHLPMTGTSACEACHVGTGSSIATLPVPNGATFANSRFSHTGITNKCDACHGPTINASSFTGVSRIVVLPPTSPAGIGSHIPSSTACETCHLGSMPAGLIPASATKAAPGSLFATPVPTSAQIHAGITGNCNACHDTGKVWMGMSYYPISPTTVVNGAQYKGFHTRPVAAASTFSVANAGHPATGDCVQCHASTDFFSAAAKPNGHIPTTQACTLCHIAGSDYSVAGLTTNMTTLHTGITAGCRTCHTAGTGAGPFAGCTTQAACASPPPLTYQPKVMPLAAGALPTTPSKQTHVPVGNAPCETCHKSVTSFAGMNMKNNATAHGAVTSQECRSCHEGGYTWFGVTIRTKGLHENRRAVTQDCDNSGCHSPNKFSGFEGLVRVHPVLRSALTMSNPRLLPDVVTGQDVAAAADPRKFDHRGVLPGQCASCHNGRLAKGLPARHLVSKDSCDTCHRVTSWTPAQFSHQGVQPGQCTTCHNGSAASGKSGSHFVTARSCDSCHRTISWVPSNYSHLSPLYRPQADKTTCVSCHLTNGEIIPRQLRANPRPRPVPVP